MTPELEALERLAPCPFCGQQPRISKRQDEDLLWSHNSVEWTFVSCSDCDVSFSSPPNSETDAVSKWNTRANPTPRPWLRAEEVKEQGSYWWVNEASHACPVTVYILKSGTDGSCFASAGQLGFIKSRNLFDMGGLWQRIPEPELPEVKP